MLAIFESHPVQYRAPVYRKLHQLVPDQFHVFYATDVSVRGNRDIDFGTTVVWDEPLLEGYPQTILNQERGEPLRGFRSLHGHGLAKVFKTFNPKAVMLTQYLYEYDFAALFHAWVRDIPIWLRQETQDKALQRSYYKEILRALVYRILYLPVKKAFYFGVLNRQHLLRHGIPNSRLVYAPYSTPDRFQNISEAQFAGIRETKRKELGITQDRTVVGFFGKLIPKKNPDLVLEAVSSLGQELKSKVTLLFVGSGLLEAELRKRARQTLAGGVQSIFAGFVNQSAIRDYYAALDILVLPSRRAGETWGLVVNEALQAGCAAAISEAVGCGAEYKSWDRVRIFPVGDALALARAIQELAAFPREYDWARKNIRAYSTEAAAEAIAGEIRKLPPMASRWIQQQQIHCTKL